MVRKQRRSISLKDKYTIVVRIRSGEAQADVARIFGLNKSTISVIWKKRDHILKAYEGHNHNSMRLRTLPNDKIDLQLYTWYRARINSNLPVNGLLLRQKAEEIARSEGQEFKCTIRWLDRFKIRHGIFFRRKPNETDQESFKHNFWPNVRTGYNDEDIFTVREVGIFFKSFPTDKLDLCCDNGELANSRMTLCICANMTGTEKRPLLIVGNKMCNVKIPVKYKYNKKCWMNLELSLEQLTSWNEELTLKSKKVILLVKFSPAFRTLSDLSQIKIGYYAENLSAHPLDPAMCELKWFYRKYLLQTNIERISRLQCIRFLYKSWIRVSAKTISKGFQILNGPCEAQKLTLIPWAEKKGLQVTDNIDDCLTFDNNLVTSVHFLSDAAGICDPLTCGEMIDLEENDEEENNEKINNDEALKMCRSLSKYIEGKENKTLLEYMVKLEHYIEDILDSEERNLKSGKE